MSNISPAEAREVVRVALLRGWCTKPGLQSADESALDQLAAEESTRKPTGRKTIEQRSKVWGRVRAPLQPPCVEHPVPAENGHRVENPLPEPQPTWPEVSEEVKEELTARAEAAVEKKSCPKCGWPRVQIDRPECNHCGGKY